MRRRWIGEGGWVIDVVACGGRPRLRVRRRGTIVRYCERVEELAQLNGLDLASFVEVVDFPHAPARDDHARPAADDGWEEDTPNTCQPTGEGVAAHPGDAGFLLGSVPEEAAVGSPGHMVATGGEGKRDPERPAELARQEALCLFEVDTLSGRYVVPDL